MFLFDQWPDMAEYASEALSGESVATLTEAK